MSKSPTIPNPKPQRPFITYPIQQIIKQQSWLILGLLAIGIGTDIISQHSDFIVSKNLLAGSIIAWIGQIVFAKITLALTGYRYRRQIVHRFYQAHLVKWLITLIGFIIVFKWLQPLKPLAVLAGFITLQISYILLTYKHS